MNHVMLAVLVCGGELESVTFAAKLEATDCVGVPLKAPVIASKVRP